MDALDTLEGLRAAGTLDILPFVMTTGISGSLERTMARTFLFLPRSVVGGRMTGCTGGVAVIARAPSYLVRTAASGSTGSRSELIEWIAVRRVWIGE